MYLLVYGSAYWWTGLDSYFPVKVFLWHNRWFFVFTFRELVCIFLRMSWIYLYLRLLWMGLSIPCAAWVNIFMSYYYPNFIFHPRYSSKWSFLLVIIYHVDFSFFLFFTFQNPYFTSFLVFQYYYSNFLFSACIILIVQKYLVLHEVDVIVSMKNISHRLRYLNTCFSGDGTV